MKTYLASDLFELTVNGNFPLDCEFIAKEPIPQDLESSGVYMMFYKQELIYIGLADGQPVIVRFQLQLSTITLRGKQIHFNSNSQKQIFQSVNLAKDFSFSILNSNAAGAEVSVNRVMFAERNWPVLKVMNQATIKDFVFVWFPENNCDNINPVENRDSWIRDLNPSCNG
jgi:hypothetical protein